MGDNFSWIFHFSLIDFSKKIFDFFSSQMPDAFGVCGTMCKVKKYENLFWGDSQLPSQNARTKVRLVYQKIFDFFFTNSRCLWGMTWYYVQGQKRIKLILGGFTASFEEF